MRQAVESWVVASISSPLLRALRLQLSKESQAFEVCLEELQGVHFADFGVKPVFQCDVMPVIGQLSRLPRCRTALEALQLFRDAVRTVTDSVQAHVESMDRDTSEIL